MDPVLGGAVIGAGANMVSNIANIGQSRRANKRMVDFWKMQNEYNHPRAQMQRLQEAGLNPALVYGEGSSGASGNAGDIGRPEVPQLDINPLGHLGDFVNLNRIKAQTDLTAQAAITERLNQELTKEKTYLTDRERHKLELDTQLLKGLGDSQIEAAKLNVDKIREEIISKQLDNDFKNSTLRNRVEDVYWKVQAAKAGTTGRKLNNELLQLQKEFLSLGLDRNSPWYAKIFGNLVRQVNN